MAATVRLRVVFEDHHMLTKSKMKEGLNRCWFLLKPHHKTISDITSHLHTAFRLHRTCPHGIILSMDGFVLPPFESTCILKDKDIVCVKRKGSVSNDDNEPPKLPSSTGGQQQLIELPKLLAIEGIQEDEEEEAGEDESVSRDDNNDQSEDAVCGESKLDGVARSKKRKASKKLKSPSQKKIKLSTTESLAVIPEVNAEENGNFEAHNHQPPNLVKKDKDKSSHSSSQPNKSSNLKQKNDKSKPMSDEPRSIQPQDENGTKKLPSRSARRKKAKRKWLRELKLQKEKLQPSPAPEKDGRELPVNNNNGVASDVHKKPDEESEAEDDIVPVEIRPGHIRFEPLNKDQAAAQTPPPVETFQWNGITSKKKGQKWGKEKISSRKQDDYEHSNHGWPAVQNSEKKRTFNAVDFDKLKPYTNSPKGGDVIAYRLVELSTSWTPELSSFRVGKISQYDSTSNRIWLEPVLEYPFDYKKKIDEGTSSVQYDPSPYGEDGSLEIDFTSLADIRTVKDGHPNLAAVAVSSNAWSWGSPSKATIDNTDKNLAGDQVAAGSCKPESGGHTPAKENGEVNVWDEINEALNAKKAKLSQKDGWKTESSGTGTWSHRAMRSSALGPTMALLRSQKEL